MEAEHQQVQENALAKRVGTQTTALCARKVWVPRVNVIRQYVATAVFMENAQHQTRAHVKRATKARHAESPFAVADVGKMGNV